MLATCMAASAIPVKAAISKAANSATPPSAESSPAAASGNGVEAFIQLNTGSQMPHLIVGHSIFLNTLSRMKRVYVGNPQVLGSLTISPNQVLITAKEAGVSSLVVWDESGRSSVYTVSSDIDVCTLQTALASAFPHDRIEATATQDRVTLSGVAGSQEHTDAAVKLAASFAKEIANSIQVQPEHIKQVQLKVRIAEVDRTRAEQLGFNFLEGGRTAAQTGTGQFSAFPSPTIGSNSSNSTLGNFPLGGQSGLSIASPLNLLLYNTDLNVALAISDLEQKQVMQILAEPTITSLSGQPASFLSGGEFPFPVVQGGTGGFTSVTIQFRPYGVKLEFTPYVNPDGTILLKVAPEVSALDYTNEVVISGYDIPAIDTRRAQTEVELKDGQSFAISGLLDHRLSDAFSRMPGIGSIPILGQFFKSYNKTASTTELVVIVTPTIVDPLHTPVPPPPLPVLSKPFLDNKKFDQQLNKKRQDQSPPPPLPEEMTR